MTTGFRGQSCPDFKNSRKCRKNISAGYCPEGRDKICMLPVKRDKREVSPFRNTNLRRYRAALA